MTRPTDAYFIPCLCGKTVESREPEAMCECGRLLVVDGWGKMPEEKKI